MLLVAASLLSCSDAPLMPAQINAPRAVEGEVKLEGDFCTDSPEDIEFPVKVLFVVDTSGSLQFTDPGQQRAIAVDNVIQRHIGNPGVQFGIIGFSGRVRDLTGGFTNDRATLAAAVDTLRIADSVTDYQGAFGATFVTLFNDMEGSGPTQRVRTKYVVVFFSDGTPQPQCSREDDEGDKFLICEFDRDDVNVPDDVFLELEAGADYNQPYQILDKVDQLMALKKRFKVGDLRIHTGFLYDEEEAEKAEAAFSLDAEAGEALLRDIAEHGSGTFLKFSAGDEIDFLSLDFNSIKRPFSVKSFIASNESALPTEGRPEADTDKDGLSDRDEFELGTDALKPDTDGDGYGDLFEVRNSGRGHDPTDFERPATTCDHVAGGRGGASDPDRDGLTTCEEVLLGSNPRIFDSDADGLPDRLEFLHGLDPSDPDDAALDLDLDGQRNFREVRWHTDASTRAVTLPGGVDRYRYRMEALGETFDGRRCSHFEIRHVGLVTPDRESGGKFGLNQIRIYLGQVPEDQPADFGLFRVACAEARFVAPDFLVPEEGVIRFVQEDFVLSAEFDPNEHCIPPEGRPEPEPEEATDQAGSPQ